jgi:glycosyltransferase involved in cell wall biosynthesis
MTDNLQNHHGSRSRPRIALITNHGYAGVEIPVGGAPDTGGQNFYVNSLAPALEALGYEITIFARGGFPFFESEQIRAGIEQLTEHVRYVYVPGGGDSFIRKEDIGIALDEETAWLDQFIAAEADNAGVAPWDYFDIFNSHYWDAAIVVVKLVERWKNQVAFDFLSRAANGKLANHLSKFDGEEKHRLGLSREIDLHLAYVARAATHADSIVDIIHDITGKDTVESRIESQFDKDDLNSSISLGKSLLSTLESDGITLATAMASVDNHVWTPHSIGIIKERNYWTKDKEVVRQLKFRERDSHEQVICNRTAHFCSTSPEISRALVAYHGVNPNSVFDFPPCIDGRIFRPRTPDELGEAYTYLSEQSGISEQTLMRSKIIFETSRMDRTKRKDILLQSFAKVAPKLADTYLFIGGGPAGNPIFKELEELKRTLPALDGRAFLLGFVPDDIIEPLFSLPDLFVSASEMEGFGMSVSQAAACKVAVISSDLIPFSTQYAQDWTVIVPAGDVEGFAIAIEKLLTNDKDRYQRAEKLFDIARELDWEATAKRFVRWYSQENPE